MRLKGMKAAIHTLGCKVNQTESEMMETLLRNEGCEITGFNDYADIYIVNTCTVTHLADRKSRQMIRRAVRKNPGAVVAAVGCMLQKDPEAGEKIEGLDIVCGTSGKDRIVEDILRVMQGERHVADITDIMEQKEFENPPVFGSVHRTRAFIKVQEGCGNFCTYCIIPYTRGPRRSREPGSVLMEAKHLTENGFREIVLTGIHAGQYGAEKEDCPDLAGLCRRILEETDISRLRLSSIEPMEITDDMWKLMASNPRFCPHLHISLQSGSDSVLQRMNRPYLTDDYARMLEKGYAMVPGLAVTTDIMVGFPGETEENFRETLAFAEKCGFAKIHVFRYSPREGTPAALFPGQIPADEKERRARLLIEKGRVLARTYAEKFLGRETDVLFEREISPGLWEGHTGNYLSVKAAGEDLGGKEAAVKIEEISEDMIKGSLIEVKN